MNRHGARPRRPIGWTRLFGAFSLLASACGGSGEAPVAEPVSSATVVPVSSETEVAVVFETEKSENGGVVFTSSDTELAKGMRSTSTVAVLDQGLAEATTTTAATASPSKTTLVSLASVAFTVTPSPIAPEPPSTTSRRLASSELATPATPARRSTGDVIDVDDPSVRFFSDNEGCAGIENGQRHPDWEGGQPNSSTNEDGAPTYGFAYNTGALTRGEIDWGFVESELALSGNCVLSMGINDAYDNTRAIRIFRRYDKNGNHFPKTGYYSVWFYFPQDVSFDKKSVVDGQTSYGFWNVFQSKDRVNGKSLSSLSVNAGKLPGDGAMNFTVYRKSECGAVEECPSSHSIEQSNPIPIPVGRWVHLEMYLKSSTGSDGRVTLWQDGSEIIDFVGQTERIGNANTHWSVNNYGRLFHPASHVLYVDDVLISSEPVHPKLFD